MKMEATKPYLKATHEAAYAVVSESFGWHVKEVVLHEGREVVQGVPSTIDRWTEALESRPKLETVGFHVAVALAGYAAIRRVDCSKELMLDAVKSVGLDWQTIEGYFKILNLEPGIKLAAIYDAVAEAEPVIAEKWKAIEKIARVLEQDHRISGDDVRRIIQEESRAQSGIATS